MAETGLVSAGAAHRLVGASHQRITRSTCASSRPPVKPCTVILGRAPAADAIEREGRPQFARSLLAAAAAAVVLAGPATLPAPAAQSAIQRGEFDLLRTASQQLLALDADGRQSFTAAETAARDNVCSPAEGEGPTALDWVGLSEVVALIGAVVGGWTARKRQEEVTRLNAQLQTINAQFKQKVARLEKDKKVRKETAGTTYDWQRSEVLDLMKHGKALLKSKTAADAREALALFEQARALIHEKGELLDDPRRAERKALRGIGVSLLLTGQPLKAVDALTQVLALSEAMNDRNGDVDAVGVIADCYAEAGDFDNAGRWYDRYISGMQSEDSDLVEDSVELAGAGRGPQ